MPFVDQIPGYKEFTGFCGGWPSFHDLEILKLELNRGAPSYLIIHVFGGPKPTIGPRSDTRLASPPTDVVVTFVLEGIDDLDLADFSSQNVIFGLRLEKESDIFRITMDPCFGMAGTISATNVTIEFSPVTTT